MAPAMTDIQRKIWGGKEGSWQDIRVVGLWAGQSQYKGEGGLKAEQGSPEGSNQKPQRQPAAARPRPRVEE